jgi:cobalt-zinc-cadmium efflux system outer membrane protein
MCRRGLIGLLLVAAWWIGSAGAEEQRAPVVEITYEEALALAREQAPALSVSRARIREAETGVEAAAVRPYNPEVSGAAGPRFEPGGTIVDWSIGLQQRFELGGQRGLRREAARAGFAAATARRADTQRRLVRDVGLAFIAALYWERRVALADENVRLVEEVARIARRRYEVGDVGGLETSVAELAVIRARSDRDRASAALAQAEGGVKALLGLQAAAALSCRGDLRRLGAPGEAPPDLGQRPDLRALRAEIDQAGADAALARTGRVPDLALGAVFSREESVDIFKGTIAIALPIFDRGQGEAGLAEARRARLRSELDAAANAAAVEARSAAEVARTLTAAALRFEDGGLDTLEHAERLATGSYEAGAIPLVELLAVRRELVQARVDYVDLLYGAATARVELSASTGALR